MIGAVRDLRLAVRTLGRSPGFAIASVLTLGVAIGGATAVFSLANAVLLKPPPFREPERLVVVSEVIPSLRERYPVVPVNARHLLEWRERVDAFEGLAALDDTAYSLTGRGEPLRVRGLRVTANLLDVLGVPPLIGRGFLPGEDQQDATPVVLLGYGLWRDRFAADAAVLGRTLDLDGRPYEVIGVLPPSFSFLRGRELGDFHDLGEGADVVLPLAFTSAELTEEGQHNYLVIGRLAPGVSREAAETALDVAQSAIAAERGEGLDLEADVQPFREQALGDAPRGLTVLVAAVGVILLIACVNIANLMLARMAGRSRETAVRAAVGASRWSLIRQLLAEGVVISAAGGAFGVLAASWLISLILGSAPADIPGLERASLDPLALTFASVASIGSGLAFAFLPAWKASRADPQDALRSGAAGGVSGLEGVRLRRWLVATEVLLSVALLVGATLLLRSLDRLLAVEPGFEVENIVAVDLALPDQKYRERTRRLAALEEIEAAAAALPGVARAGLITERPLGPEGNVNMILAEGAAPVPMWERPTANFRWVTPQYFVTLGISLLEGRIWRPSDEDVAVVSESVAEFLWPGEEPVGRRILLIGGRRLTVVGVVEDVALTSLEQDREFVVYQPLAGNPRSDSTLFVRTSNNPSALAPALRETIWGIDNAIAVPEVRPMARLISESTAERRFQTTLLAAFACVALSLALIGVYGVVSYSAAQRRREIGVRLALGARRADVRRWLLREGMLPVAGGLAGGLLVGVAVGRLLQGLLYEVGPADPIALVAAPAALAVAAFAACLRPAQRAALVEPVVILRQD